ncbi:hypothetical protein BCL57_001153 [Agromyces flavus]|uniref:DUF3558 domain-containing protein n=1 Tax=Agromyces flavus TaxID=589382 RepID=A0A1H1ZAQ0_9MICO|nr:hypothetical protein [Agromyces flavus]MCP2366999.1 hypothetical protein [Agromyces flavus]GGI46602.1 hypothetical protein GCM10010932_15440 [Agromyces flavus]SDT30657.1 hypothetical protein SAMN04489721_3078 [Agromyces flavus]
MTRPHSRRAAAATPLLVLFALGVAGCTAGVPAPSDTAEPSPSPAASTSETPEASPSEAPAVGATCDTVLTPEAYTKLEADGLVPMPFTPFDPVEVRIADEGGLTCSWGKPQTDLVLAVAQVATGGDDAAWTAALADGGYTPTDDPVAGAYTGQPDAGNGITPIVILADGTITFVSVPAYAGWVRPAS